MSQGIAPTVVDRFRTRVAAATGICQSCRCRVIAAALASGQDSDPVVKVAREQVSFWLSLWNKCFDLRAILGPPGFFIMRGFLVKEGRIVIRLLAP